MLVLVILFCSVSEHFFPPLHVFSNTDIKIHPTTVWFMAHRESHTCWKYLSQLMYSLSWESCSLLVLMYCQRAWMIQERVWVWMPSRRARRGSSLNWGGCGDDIIALHHFLQPPTSELFTSASSQLTSLSHIPRLGNRCQFCKWSLKCTPSVSADCWLSAMWGLQVVTATAGFMAQISYSPNRGESISERSRELSWDRLTPPTPHPPPHLIVQHQQQSAAHAHVSRPFHLEAVRLLGGGRAMPLEERNHHSFTTHHTLKWFI